MKICISTDFSETPGARHRSDGDYSGEEFRETILIPKYIEAITTKKQLKIEGRNSKLWSFVLLS